MAKGLCFSVCLATRGEYTAISSDMGPSVPRIREPRTTMPASASRTTPRAEARVVLHVVQRRDGAHAVGQPRVRGHVLDALAPQPHVALLVLEPLDVLPSGPSTHVRRESTRTTIRSTAGDAVPTGP